MFHSTKTNHPEICQLTIRTSSKSVTSHIDKSNKLAKPAEREPLNQWKHMVDDETLHPNEQRSLQCQYNFSLEFGTSVHATCGYQYPTISVNSKTKSTIPLN
jgi:hypothetical protein